MLGDNGQTISVVMIARDEEHNIARALNSVKEAVDELIVVDTGSVDKTAEIAKSLGARVTFFPWRDDFSAAKNFAIEQASGDWLLLLDADDEIHPEDCHKIRELLQEPDVDCFYFDTLSFYGEVKGLYIRMPQPRLIRNRPQFRFSGRIHETLNLRGAVTAFREIRVNHYGYLNKEIESKQKIRRNRMLLEQELDDHPTALNYFYLATEDLRAGDHDQALKHFEKSQELYEAAGLKPPSEMLKKKIIALQELGRFLQVHTEIESAREMYPDYTDLIFLKGECLERQGNLPQAIETYQGCIEQGETPYVYSSLSGVGTYTAYYRIGYLHSRIGNNEAAIKAYLESLRCNTAYVPAVHALAEVLVKDRSRAEVISFLRERFDMNVPVANRYFAEAFVNAGEYQLALHYVDQFEKTGSPADDEIVLLRASCLMFSGGYEQAIRLFDSIPPDSPKFLRASFFKCIHCWLKQNFDRAETILKGLLRENRFPAYELEVCLTVNEILVAGEVELPKKLFSEIDHLGENAIISLLELFVLLDKIDWVAKIRIHFPDRLQQTGRLVEFINLLHKQQKISEAALWLEKIGEEERSNLEIACLHGEIYLASGSYHEAQRWFQQVLAQSSCHLRAMIGMSQISYGYYLESLKRIKQNRISLCMIVKNEEKYLAGALQSVQGIVEEMIVVDTGSEDGTVKIAQEMGAQVLHFAWNGNFADARNFALEKASCEWILMLDADERLDPEGKGRLSDLVSNPEIDGYFLTVKSGIDESYTVVDRRLSFFRNKREYRFEGAIHEQIPPGKFWVAGKRLEIADVVIRHEGYLDSVMREKHKLQRNLAIIQKQLQSEPENPFYHYCLAVELMQQEQYGKAAEHLDFSLQQWTAAQPQTPDAICKIAQCYLMEKQYKKSERWLRKGIELFPDFPDLHYFLGICFLAQGNWLESAESLQTCLQLGSTPPHYNSFEGVTSFHVYHGLAIGRFQIVKEVLELGLLRFPESIFLQEKMSQLKQAGML
ncbi:glycosyltransferase [Effusibacillus consociatus]|uniref:Glycosyltransferase n=1 Tax=Effusibacillus consociatus TaxID=1117041 RepID=A0ABV9PYC6_9BACL